MLWTMCHWHLKFRIRNHMDNIDDMDESNTRCRHQSNAVDMVGDSMDKFITIHSIWTSKCTKNSFYFTKISIQIAHIVVHPKKQSKMNGLVCHRLKLKMQSIRIVYISPAYLPTTEMWKKRGDLNGKKNVNNPCVYWCGAVCMCEWVHTNTSAQCEASCIGTVWLFRNIQIVYMQSLTHIKTLTFTTIPFNRSERVQMYAAAKGEREVLCECCIC